jgi:hypothetical protein
MHHRKQIVHSPCRSDDATQSLDASVAAASAAAAVSIAGLRTRLRRGLTVLRLFAMRINLLFGVLMFRHPDPNCCSRARLHFAGCCACSVPSSDTSAVVSCLPVSRASS